MQKVGLEYTYKIEYTRVASPSNEINKQKEI